MTQTLENSVLNVASLDAMIDTSRKVSLSGHLSRQEFAAYAALPSVFAGSAVSPIDLKTTGGRFLA